MRNGRLFGLLGILMTLVASRVEAGGSSIGSAVEVEIRSGSGITLPLYPTSGRAGVRKAYAEARKGDEYTIVVRNRLPQRVGVVVAVDGRNIISGKKSHLKRSERMYILNPYGTGEFSGWRTAADKVNRFYFTESGDSYAAAFDDVSAMGVIAVAVYPEVVRYEPERDAMMAAPSFSAKRAPAPPAAAAESAGTGYGREEYSPVREVVFEAESLAAETIYIRYEWHETLCRNGIILCGKNPLENRMWRDDRFAPPPPGR